MVWQLSSLKTYFRKHTVDAPPISFIADPDEFIPGARKSIGIDPAWGSSAFGIVIWHSKTTLLYCSKTFFIKFNCIYAVCFKWGVIESQPSGLGLRSYY